MKIQEALANVMADVQAVAKKERNNAQGFNFRGIDSVVNAVAPALRAHKVVVVPLVEDYTYNTVEVGKNRTSMAHVIVTVRYRFTGEEGDSLDALVIGEAMDSGDKAVAKAMSVAFRIALLQALALPTDEPDPDASSYERSEAKPKADSEMLAGFEWSLANSKDLEALSSIATDLNRYDISDETRAHLRSVYLKRKSELEASA